MGSPVAPSYANAFLCHHEVTWLSSCPVSFKPVYYKRYMDDTFLIFEHHSHIQLFLDYLNSRHPSIKFTCETEQEGKLSFLDTTITNNNGQFSTNTYRKPTFTGLGLHYLSFLPPIYKINSIKTLLTRAYNVCSSWKAFHDEIVFLQDYFLCNGYPSKLVDKTINNFLNLKLNPPPPIATVNKDVRYFKLPYMGKLSFEIRKSFKEILKHAYPQIKFNFVFTNTNTIRNFLTKKPKPSPDLCSNVVYLFKCPSCPAEYVGSTSRWLKHRILEHRGRSIRTEAILAKPAFSPIREHSQNHSHPFTATDFTILSHHTNRLDVVISESLYINKMQPTLNGQTTATTLYTQ